MRGQYLDNSGQKVGGEFLISPSLAARQDGPGGLALLTNGQLAVAFSDKFSGDYDVSVQLTGISQNLGLSTSGSFMFQDVDLADTHSVTVAPEGSSYIGTFIAGLTSDPTGGGSGAVNWTFGSDQSELIFLNPGQSVHQYYGVSVMDNNGGTFTQTVDVLLHGSVS